MSQHQLRLNAEFMRVLSECMREIRDPRYSQMTSVLRVEITKDLKHAKVYVSVFESDKERIKETVEILNHASGMLGHAMSSKILMRRIPNMHFVADSALEYSAHIAKIIEGLHKDDPKVEVEDTSNIEDSTQE